jgi:hypothetical protein
MAAIDLISARQGNRASERRLKALRREPENSLYRDALIQRFEFTYGLVYAPACWNAS